jgi:O-antigen/teichoic acid export membrane protein
MVSAGGRLLPTNHTQEQLAVDRSQQEFKSQMGNISRQSGVFFAGTIFTALAGYIFKIYLARTLGSEALGIYALGMTVAGLFGIFGGLGISWAALRFPAAYASTGRREELQSFVAWGVLILSVVNGVLAGGIVLARHWVAIKLYHTPALANYLHLFAFILFTGALTNFFGQLLTGFKGTAKRTIITNFVGVLLNIFLAVILLTLGTGLWGYIVAQVVSAVVVLGLLIWASYRIARIPFRFRLNKFGFLRGMFAFAAAAFAMELMNFLYAQTDKIILGSYLNARMVGIYSVAATMVAFIAIILQSVNQIFSPTIAELHARGESALLNRLYQTLTKWIIGLTLPLATVVIVFSRILMRIFGHEFEVGWVILVIGAIGQLVNCATGSVGYFLLMSGNEKKLVRIQMAMAVVTVVLCLWFVSRWGIVGAAVATATANAGTNLWCLAEVRKSLGLFPYNRTYGMLAAPTLVTAAVAIGLRVGLKSVSADIAVVVASVAIVYSVFLATVLLLGLNADDRLIASAIWRRIRTGSLGFSATSPE